MERTPKGRTSKYSHGRQGTVHADIGPYRATRLQQLRVERVFSFFCLASISGISLLFPSYTYIYICVCFEIWGCGCTGVVSLIALGKKLRGRTGDYRLLELPDNICAL